MLSRQVFIPALTFGLIAVLAGLILFFARGYRLNINEREITGTGIILINSTPSGALVYLNEIPQDATNTTIRNLRPGRYQLRVEKQGYISWRKDVLVEEEVVSEEYALLVPLFPELKPLTFTGAQNPLLSPDAQKIAYQSQTNGEAGLYLLDLAERPFNLTNRPTLLAADTAQRKYSQFLLKWSPDSTQILLQGSDENENPKEAFLLDTASKGITPVKNLEALQTDWRKQKETASKTLLESFPLDNQQIIATIDNPIWSPDNSKILFEESGEQEKDTRVFKVLDFKPKDLRKAAPELTTVFTYKGEGWVNLTWYPDSQHLLILEKESSEAASGKISLVEISGTNLAQTFEGTIIGKTLIPSPNGSRVIILTSFNPASQQYNLYSINLR